MPGGGPGGALAGWPTEAGGIPGDMPGGVTGDAGVGNGLSAYVRAPPV